MKSFNKFGKFLAGGLVLLAVGGVAARAELEKWAQNAEASSDIERALFKVFALPSGSVVGRRTPAESRAELSTLIKQNPSKSDFYSLRALEAERQLDFAAAEADWKKFADTAANKYEGSRALATYYERRVQPKEELAALEAAAAAAGVSGVEAANAYSRMLALIDEQDMDAATSERVFRGWVKQAPESQEPLKKAVGYFFARRDFPRAEAFLAEHEKAFPREVGTSMELRAGLETARGTPQAALSAFDRAFQADWPDEAARAYMGLAADSGKIRELRDGARARLNANPDDLTSVARLYHYYRHQQDTAAAVAVLNAYLTAKESRQGAWAEAELVTLAGMFEASQQFDQAARCYHSLYLKGGEKAGQGLTSIVRLLLEVPEQRLAIGSGDLVMYRDIAKADPYPGYLNGVLSLLLNTSAPWSEYNNQNNRARPFFHRAQASELLELVDQKYPNATERPALRARLIDAYAVYGESEAVVREGVKFMTSFPAVNERSRVQFAMADAYVRLGREREEFEIYDQLLRELGQRANGVPVGATANAGGTPAARSPEYVRALDRYIGRLVSSKRIQPALAVYRAELDRNTNDPGIYERLAAFLDQNKLGAEVEQVYRKAMEKFPDKSWSHKLARWYLRQKRTADFEALTREVTRAFAGTDLENYFRAVVPRDGISQAMYRQLNQYARERFPHNLEFVRNLLNSTPESDPVAEKLLRENWFHAPDLRSRFFEMLSRTKRLDSELQALAATNPSIESNVVALRMLAEGEAWRTRFEAAKPHFSKLASGVVLDDTVTWRAAALHRSLSDLNGAVAIEESIDKYGPLDTAARIRMGEIFADREQFTAARTIWDRIPEQRPGHADSYLEAATLYWDYFQFDDALRTIAQGRTRVRNNALYSYEEAAIHENRRDYPKALAAYTKGALAGEESSKARLLQLAERSAMKAPVEQSVAAVAAGSNPSVAAANLLIRLYEVQGRREDLETKLLDWAGSTDSAELLAAVEQSANANAMPKVTLRAAERRVQLAADPVEKLRLRLDLARLLEGQGDKEAAARAVEQVYAEHPAIMGVIRTAVNLQWRAGSKPRALEILEASAARAADADLKHSLLLEAAQKSAASGDLDRANRLADGLLRGDPFRSDYLAAKAAVFAGRKDDAGLREFYRASMDSLNKAPLSSGERIARVASMRRDLIPVLKRSGDAAGALDQYIELINRYPEDEGLVREAGRFATESGQEKRLTDFYSKTVADSPKDYRWAVTLSSLQSQFGDASGAVVSLQKATAVRPDRVDLLTRQADLEERLLKFEDAGASFRKLYELSYRDPQWMSRAALSELRLGRQAEAIKTLRKGYLEDRPDTVANYAAVANRLNEWGVLVAAKETIAQGLKVAGGDGSSAGELPELDGALTARMHQRLAQPASLGVAAAKSWWRGVARGVREYGTPAEKLELAAAIERPEWTDEDRITVATQAGLQDVLAKQLASDNRFQSQLETLQESRGRFDELGGQLEVFVKAMAPTDEQRANTLRRAQEAYRRSGNTAGELRVISLLRSGAEPDQSTTNRYAELIGRQPQTALRILTTTKDNQVRMNLLHELMLAGRSADVMAGIKAAGAQRTPVWTNSYSAIAGLYFGDTSAGVKAAFQSVLGPATIGERLIGKADPNRQLIGDPWFYYADRYSEFLKLANDPSFADYAGAEIEGRGAGVASYFKVGEQYAVLGDYAKAREEFAYAAQFPGAGSSVAVRIAAALSREGKAPEATEAWKAAFESLQNDINRGVSAPSEIASAIRICTATSANTRLQPAIDKTVEMYLQRFGTYDSTMVLQAGYKSIGDPAKATEWMLRMSEKSPSSGDILRSLVQPQWLSDAQQSVVYEKLAARLTENQAQLTGEARESANGSIARARVEQIRLALKLKQTAKASALLAAVPPQVRTGEMDWQFRSLDLRIAAETGSVVQLAEKFRREPSTAPELSTILTVATELREAGANEPANALLEFAYQREIENGSNAPSNYSGLASVRLSRKDTEGALRLLRRMVIAADDVGVSLGAATDLLESNGLRGEAKEFLEMARKLKPWDGQTRLRLGEFEAVATDAGAQYRLRCRAASEISRTKLAALKTGVPEIDLLSGGALTEAAAAQRYFVDAPLAAAREAKGDAKLRLLEFALATEPAESGLKTRTALAAAELRRDALAFGLTDGLNGPGSVALSELGLVDQRAVLRAFSAAAERRGAIEVALQYEAALRDHSGLPAAERTTSLRRTEAMDRALALRQFNNEYMPNFSDEVVAGNPVRPRAKVLPVWIADSTGGVR